MPKNKHTYDELSEENKNLKAQIKELLLEKEECSQKTTDDHKIQKAKDEENKKNERFRLICNLTNNYVFSTTINPDGSTKFEWIEGAFEAITGYTVEEYVALGGWRSNIYPDDLFIDDKDMSDIKSNKEITSELRTINKSGEIVWVQIFARPIWDPKENRVTTVYGSVQDISERKKAEQELQKSEERFRILIEQAADGIFHGDQMGNFLGANSKAVEMTGYSKEDMLTMNMGQLFSEEEKNRTPLRYDLLNKGHVVINERVLTKKDGSTCNIEMHTKMLPDKTYQSIFRDITERKKAEAELRESENRYRYLFENNPMPMLIYERNSLQMLAVNDAFLNHYGYTIDQVLKMHLPDLYPEKQKEHIADLTSKLHGYTIAGEWQHRKADNSFIDIIAYSHDVLFKGHDCRIAVISDITQRKLAEEELRKSEEKYRLIFEYSPLGLLLFNERGVIIDCNDNFVEIIGSSREKLIGLNMSNLPDKNIVSAVQKALTGNPGMYEGVYSSVTAKKETPVRCLFTPMNIGDSGNLGGVGIIEDITERKKVEEALRESEEKYRNVADFTYDWEQWISQDGKYIYMSPSCERITGYTPDELMTNQGLLDIIAFPEDQELVSRHLHEDFNEKPATSIEFRIITKSGELRWIEHVCQPCYSSNGLWLGRRGSNRDITESKRTEQALRESEETYRSIFENTGTASIIIEEDTTIALANAEWVSLSGFSREENEGKKKWTEFVVPGDLERMKEYHHTRRDDEFNAPRKYEFRFIRRNGEIRNMINSVTMIPGTKRSIASLTDMTESKHAEETLRESEEKYRTVIESATDSIFIIKNGLIEFVNHVLIETSGYTEKELIGQPFLNYVAPKNREKAKEYYTKRIRGESSPTTYETNAILKNGREMPVETTVSVFNFMGECAELVFMRDIRDRKEAELKLIRSKSELQSILDATIDVIALLNNKGEFITCNDQLAKRWGKTREEIIGHSAAEILPAHIFESRMKFMLEAIATKSVIRFVDSYNELFFEQVIAPIVEPEGSINNVAMFSRDITEKYIAEHKIAESEKKLKEAQRIAKIGNWELDLVANKLYWSDEIYFIFELDKELFDASYDAFLDAIHPDDRQMVDKAYSDSLKDKTSYEITHRILMNDGRIKFVTEKCYSIYNNNGDPILSVGTIQDITDLKNIEIELAKREKQLSSIFETVGNAIFLLEVKAAKDNKKEYIFISVNKAFESVTGIPYKTVIGKSIKEIIPNFSIEPFLEKYYQSYGKNEVITKEETFDLPKGIITVIITITPIYNDEGVCTHLVGSALDITERKKAEKEILLLNQTLEERVMKRTKQFEEANKDLEAFAYSVSHDLRSPLRHIDGFLRILKSHIPESTEQGEYYFGKIIESSRKMASMIDDLLKFSRLGRQDLIKSSVDLNVLIKEVINQFKPETENRNIEFNIGKLPIVEGDYNLLKMVFENLISNAIKFTSKKEVALVEVGTLETPENSKNIYIKDNGAGFEMTYAGKLFGVFQRLHSNNEFEGTGIGLANVKQILQKHGATIYAEGEVDKGATFYIKF
jgi:PAS domain S-box-containing protein